MEGDPSGPLHSWFRNDNHAEMVLCSNLGVGEAAAVQPQNEPAGTEMSADDPGELSPEDSLLLDAEDAEVDLGVSCESDDEDMALPLRGTAGDLEAQEGIEEPPPVPELIVTVTGLQGAENVTRVTLQAAAPPEGSTAQPKKLTEAQQRKAAFEASWTHIPEPEDVNIDRPVFTGQEKGGPRGRGAKLTADSPVTDFFSLYWDDEFITKHFRDGLNTYANSKNAGADDAYPDFTNFSLSEVKKSLGFLIYQGLHPAPHWRYHFRDPKTHKVWGHEFLRNLYGKRNAEHRFQQFKTFFHLQNPHLPKPDGHNLWKLGDILEETRKRCEKLWLFGKKGSIDEMTIGFKGRCAMKLRITYKAEGDGFQFDAICDDGYTYSWSSRHEKAPNMDKDLSPTHNRVLWLLSRLRVNEKGVIVKDKETGEYTDHSHDYTQIWMDNLYLSHKLCVETGRTDRAHPPTAIAGPARTNRGLTDIIKQKAETSGSKAEPQSSKRTTTATPQSSKRTSTEDLCRTRSEEAAKKPKRASYMTAKKMREMQGWNGRFHRFELVQNEHEGSTKYCCICSKEKVENSKEKMVPKKVRAKLTCLTCNDEYGGGCHFCGEDHWNEFPAHIEREPVSTPK